MTTTALLSLAFLSLFGGPADLSDSCPVSDTPVVRVSPLQPGFAVSHDRSRIELGAMIGQKAFPGFYTQGVTDVTYGSRIRIKLASARLSDGRWCATARGVEAEFGLTSTVDVHVASEIVEGGCRYRTVLAHEMRHVAIAQRAVLGAVRDAQLALEERLARSPTFFGPDEAGATSALQTALEEVVDLATKARIASAEMENASIDTRASYEELRDQCPGSPD
jgi:hypothetical protein